MAMLRQCFNRTVVGLGIWVLLQQGAMAAPDTTLTIAPSATSGATILAADENDRNADISTAYNSHSHTDITQVGTPLNVGASSGRSSIGDASIVMEGSTNNDSETTITVTDPSADRTVTIPNATGTVLLDTDIANQVLSGGSLTLEGATANDFESTVTITDPTADRAIVLPDAAGTIVLTASSPTLATVTVNLLTTSTVGPATPVANTLYTDNIIKGWIKFDDGGTAAIVDDFNVASIADNGTGDYTITWETDFANDDYAIAGSAVDAGTPDHVVVVVAQAVGTTQITRSNSGGTAVDGDGYLIAVGD